VGGGTDAQIALMEEYGRNLGIAFQIVDDVLDYTGKEATIGKPAGNDLRQGLVTLPLIYALRSAQNGRAEHVTEHVAELLGQSAPAEDAVAGVVAWERAGPAISEALDLARHYGSRARALLSEFPASPDRTVLEELVDFVIERNV
jgi:geranylgeranyl pyrophosphate synthase